MHVSSWKTADSAFANGSLVSFAGLLSAFFYSTAVQIHAKLIMALKKKLLQVVSLSVQVGKGGNALSVRYCTCPGLLRKLGIVLHQVFLRNGPQMQLKHFPFYLYCKIWIKCPSGIFSLVQVEGIT